MHRMGRIQVLSIRLGNLIGWVIWYYGGLRDIKHWKGVTKYWNISAGFGNCIAACTAAIGLN